VGSGTEVICIRNRRGEKLMKELEVIGQKREESAWANVESSAIEIDW